MYGAFRGARAAVVSIIYLFFYVLRFRLLEKHALTRARDKNVLHARGATKKKHCRSVGSTKMRRYYNTYATVTWTEYGYSYDITAA